MKQVLELFGTRTDTSANWSSLVTSQTCPFDGKKCYKTRKSDPSVSIGSCTVGYRGPVMICPKRLTDRGKIFTDVLHLLRRHEPGDEYHLLPEFSVPGGSIDYVVASVRNRKVVDFVGIEIQTLDTTGTVWPYRQKFLIDQGVISEERIDDKSYGMNWKMTSKTILVQMHHKAQTFASLDRHLVLAVQDRLLHYMQAEFDFAHFSDPAEMVNTVHMHGYGLTDVDNQARYGLSLEKRISTDVAGIERSLGLRTDAVVQEGAMFEALTKKVSSKTLLDPFLGGPD
ncbi:MAG: NotI family restriction endonuclease [Microcella sp.]